MSRPSDRRVDWPTEDPEPDPDAPTPPDGMRRLRGRAEPPEPPDDDDDTDDPTDGCDGPGEESDRLWVHLVWEAILLAGVVVVALLAKSVLIDDILSGRALDLLLVQTAGVGLIATGLACSMRAAVPNLAVGAVATSAGVLLNRLQHEDIGFFAASLMVLFAAVAVGLALAVVVVGLHVPAWAASLGAGLLVAGAAITIEGTEAGVIEQDSAVTDNPWPWFALFIVVSVAGGLACAAPAVRGWLGGLRGDRDPGRRPDLAAATGAAAAIVVSTVLAAAGGIVFTSGLGFAEPRNTTGLTLTVLAAVLIGGVSAFGRRGGIFGTVLGVVLIVLVLRIVAQQTDEQLHNLTLGAAIVAGLVVNRLLEAVGRRTVPRSFSGQR